MQPNHSSRVFAPPKPNTLQLAFGLGLVLLGSILTLDLLNLADADRLFKLWPTALILAGAVAFVRASDGDARLWAGGWMVVGALILLTTLGLSRVGFWGLLWPLVLIVVGVRLGLRALGRSTAASREAGGGSGLVAIFGESKRAIQDRPFKGASMSALFGSCFLDLRQADVQPGEMAVVDCFAMFAAHEIVVPPGWVVESHVTPIAASVEDERPARAKADPSAVNQAPRLILQGALLFAGLKIRD
jgi:hypothetical protein